MGFVGPNTLKHFVQEYFGDYKKIKDIGDGTVTDAISTLNNSLLPAVNYSDEKSLCFTLFESDKSIVMFGWCIVDTLLNQWTKRGTVSFGRELGGTGYAVITSAERTSVCVSTTFGQRTKTGFNIYVEDSNGNLTDAVGHTAFYLVLAVK